MSLLKRVVSPADNRVVDEVRELLRKGVKVDGVSAPRFLSPSLYAFDLMNGERVLQSVSLRVESTQQLLAIESSLRTFVSPVAP